MLGPNILKRVIKMAFARRKLPEPLQLLLKSEMQAAIEQANLGNEDTEIATLYLIERIPQADIAAALHYERSTISRRLPGITEKVIQTAHRLNFT